MADNPFLIDLPDPPTPPELLYKYVVPERVDVLERLRIRFSPLLTTNDDFEVRRTFRQLVGPRMKGAFNHELMRLDVDALMDERLSKALAERGLPDQAKPLVQALLRQQLGGAQYQEGFRSMIQGLLGQFLPMMNSDEQIQRLLHETIGSGVALSLTDDPQNPTMWGYYADQQKGFVIAFDAASPFFSIGTAGKRRKLQQISYFDGELEEALDNPRLAFMSKGTRWSHEREWRLYAREEDANQVIEADEQRIHLFAFPPEMVRGVYVRRATPPQITQRIRAALAEHYPRAFLKRLEPDRMKSRYVEVPI
jgi:hypothetical protein